MTNRPYNVRLSQITDPSRAVSIGDGNRVNGMTTDGIFFTFSWHEDNACGFAAPGHQYLKYPDYLVPPNGFIPGDGAHLDLPAWIWNSGSSFDFRYLHGNDDNRVFLDGDATSISMNNNTPSAVLGLPGTAGSTGRKKRRFLNTISSNLPASVA